MSRGMGRGRGGGGGRGRGMGQGRGGGQGRGRGMGEGRGGGRGMGRGLVFDSALDGSPPPESQGAAREAQAMMNQLRAINKRLSELEGTGLDPAGAVHLDSAKPRDGEGRILGMTAIVDRERCLCCGICADICPEHAITMTDTAEIDANRCNACGSCINECPTEAISLSEKEKPVASRGDPDGLLESGQ